MVPSFLSSTSSGGTTRMYSLSMYIYNYLLGWALTRVGGRLPSHWSINGHGPVPCTIYMRNVHSCTLPLSGNLRCCYTALLRTSASHRFLCATRRYFLRTLINYAWKLAADTLTSKPALLSLLVGCSRKAAVIKKNHSLAEVKNGGGRLAGIEKNGGGHLPGAWALSTLTRPKTVGWALTRDNTVSLLCWPK